MRKLIAVAENIWGFIVRSAAWLFARRLPIAVCAVVLAALWIMYGHAQNGRYALYFHPDANITFVLDTRTGTIYRSGFGFSEWAESHPQTGRLDYHPTRRPYIAPAPPPSDPNDFEKFMRDREKKK